MKKSEIYKKAQVAVLNDESLSEEEKLDILRELIKKRDLAIFAEREGLPN